MKKLYCWLMGHLIMNFTGYDECVRCGKVWIIRERFK